MRNHNTYTSSGNGRTETVELSESERHTLLASERRRATLEVLVGRTGPVELADLATAVVGREPDTDESDVERVALTLHHVHLPKMESVDVIEYDSEACSVERIRVDSTR